MSNWEYKIISSGRGGFASPALMEKFLNDLGQEQWEIIHYHTPPDNPLAFSGLARRRTERDWTLEDAAKTAARAEADKLRAEFEAKFKAATGAAQPAEEPGETFLAEEKVGADDGFRRLRDTSRDDDPDAPEDENGGKDDWDKLSEEDELPTFFEALRPHMRRNQRGPGMSVGVDYLAKKWKLDESDIKGALVECGLQIPADENAKPVHVEFEGDLFWVNINRRGEIWINVREKPEPKFRIVPGTRVEPDDEPQSGQPRQRDREPRAESPAAEAEPAEPPREKTFLDQVRGLMRRNRHGHGWSGSFGFLTKALKTDEAGLLAQLEEQGLKLAPEGAEKPEFHEEHGMLYWMQKNPRGEIWINARKEKKQPAAPEGAEPPVIGSGPEPAGDRPPASIPSAENQLAALRLLLQPKKRGEGVAAQVSDIADQLGRPAIELLEALVRAGLNVPDDPDTKPAFGEHAGEIFWLNRNAKGELWLNAKPARAKRSRSRSQKQTETDAAPEEAPADEAPAG